MAGDTTELTGLYHGLPKCLCEISAWFYLNHYKLLCINTSQYISYVLKVI